MRDSFEAWMRLALEVARDASGRGDVPVGAIVVDQAGEVLARAGNAREETQDPAGHAELLALRSAAAALGRWRLQGCTLVVTLEPCSMCAGAAQLARVDRVVFGAWNPEYGAAGSLWDLLRDRRLNHRPEVVGGVLEQECGDLLSGWFEAQRAAERPIAEF